MFVTEIFEEPFEPVPRIFQLLVIRVKRGYFKVFNFAMYHEFKLVTVMSLAGVQYLFAQVTWLKFDCYTVFIGIGIPHGKRFSYSQVPAAGKVSFLYFFKPAFETCLDFFFVFIRRILRLITLVVKNVCVSLVMQVFLRNSLQGI